jgi:tRNA dimethylallyltransferase
VNERVLVLGGATATGKTGLAIELAKRFGAEIVGADSRQIYRGMPIGTAAPSAAQLAAVRHHLIGFLDSQQRYSAACFMADAQAAIEDIHARGKRAIVVGGTGFYIRALTGGVELAQEPDPRLRERLARETRLHDATFLHSWLATRDPARAAVLAVGDTYRVVRALEVALGPAPESTGHRRSSTLFLDGKFYKVVLDVPLAEIDARIEVRTDAMLGAGLLEEAERIGEDVVAANAVGYPQAFAFLRGWVTYEELRTSLIRATRRYARRQRAWFRYEPDVLWARPDELESLCIERLGWK